MMAAKETTPDKENTALCNWTGNFFYFLFFDKLGNNKIIEVLFSLVKQGILRKPLFGLVRKENLQRQRVLKTLMSPTGAISAKHFGHVLVSVLHNLMSPR